MVAHWVQGPLSVDEHTHPFSSKPFIKPLHWYRGMGCFLHTMAKHTKNWQTSLASWDNTVAMRDGQHMNATGAKNTVHYNTVHVVFQMYSNPQQFMAQYAQLRLGRQTNETWFPCRTRLASLAQCNNPTFGGVKRVVSLSKRTTSKCAPGTGPKTPCASCPAANCRYGRY